MGMAIHVRGGLAILTFCAALSTSSLADALPRDLDEYITSGMEAWKIPGLSVVVVTDGAVVHAKGYGVLKAGEPEKVNEDTIFAIGSASRAARWPSPGPRSASTGPTCCASARSTGSSSRYA